MLAYRALALLALVLAAHGCATITSSELQNVSVSAVDQDMKPIEGASCKLRNDKGSWDAKTPGFVAIRRSSEDLAVECSKEGQPNGILRAVSRAAACMFGNIIFGGAIGAIIDHSKGTGYDYPETSCPSGAGRGRCCATLNVAPSHWDRNGRRPMSIAEFAPPLPRAPPAARARRPDARVGPWRVVVQICPPGASLIAT